MRRYLGRLSSISRASKRQGQNSRVLFQSKSAITTFSVNSNPLVVSLAAQQRTGTRQIHTEHCNDAVTGLATMSTTINKFLENTQLKLRNLSAEQECVIVMGNDAADLDSVISALLFAYFSAETDSKTLYIPLVKVPSADLKLRPELDFVMHATNVDIQKLLCIDQIDLKKLSNARLVLVDHNKLTAPFDDSKSAQQVIGVLDHHVDEQLYRDVPLRVISMVGSCVTLVVRHFQDRQFPPDIAKLALAPILVDTINLNWDLHRTTDADVDAYNTLIKTCGDIKGYYEQIEAAKSNIRHLSTRDLLRKDYKEFVVHQYRVGTSSLPWYFDAWVARDGYTKITQETMDYMKERNLDLEMVLTSFDHTDSGGQYEREFAIFINNDALMPIKQTLESNTDLALRSLQYTPENTRVAFYKQGNIKISRKQVWPLTKSMIEQQIK